MEKDIGKIKKNEITDIVVRIDDFGGKVGLTIREFTTSDRYTGFTKSGTRIPAESFPEFKQMINSIEESEVKAMQDQAGTSKPDSSEKPKEQKQLTNKKDNSNSEEIEEEIF
ncbi:MAG: hypothetical protein ABIH37_04550 [archaeon]